MKVKGNAIVIQSLFSEMDLLGVSEFCVCAGARNAPIIEALTSRAASVQNAACKIYHFFDERSAAFFALGRVMESRRPVAVLTTSGTAAAELLPAMVEAYYQNLPLVAVTADRPSRYRDSGAPQAIEQQGIFGIYATSVNLESEGNENIPAVRSGSVHFNVRLEEEFTAVDVALINKGAFGRDVAETVSAVDRAITEAFCNSEGALLVTVAGLHPDDAPLATDMLLRLDAPIVAEATSNLGDREELKPLLVRGGEKSFRQINPKRILRIGAVPSWRWWRDLDGREDVSVLNLTRALSRAGEDGECGDVAVGGAAKFRMRSSECAMPELRCG